MKKYLYGFDRTCDRITTEYFVSCNTEKAVRNNVSSMDIILKVNTRNILPQITGGKNKIMDNAEQISAEPDNTLE